MSIVTISRQDSSGGQDVAAEVARRLGCRLVDRSLMKELIYSYDLLSAIGRIDESCSPDGEGRIRQVSEGIIRHLAFQEDIILLGYGGQFLFRDFPHCFHVRIIASVGYRAGRCREAGPDNPEEVLQRREKKRRRLVRRYSGEDLTLPEHYDLILKMDTFSVTAAAAVVTGAVGDLPRNDSGSLEAIRKHAAGRGEAEIRLDPISLPSRAAAAFAHPSEAEFAQVLDFYRIRWEYEPASFPVDWWPDGRVRESFTPDFYLPDLDTYLELTTMKQALVTKKNRKIRRFRELYPERKLTIFYGRDYRKLALKYGLE